MFINRVSELALLEKQYRSGKAEFFVLYGRRRVGKTELLAQFCKDKKSIFYVSDLGSEISLRTSLSSAINQILFDSDRIHAVYSSWEDLFQALGKAAEAERLVVVFDEFPTMLSAHSPLAIVLQKMWDQILKDTKIMLILSGSDTGVMEESILGYQAPLYGRRTSQYLLEPFLFKDAKLFFQNYDDHDQVRMYAILGGTPGTLSVIDNNSSLKDNLLNTILSRGSYLFDEARYVLQQEIREPRNYFAILQAVAAGKTRLNEIKQATGIEGAHVYLDTLQQLHLIERIVPITESQPHKSRRGLYRIKDHYLRFWFRFVLPHRSQLERGAGQLVLENQIMPELDHFTSLAFEEVCRQYFWQRGISGKLSFPPKTIGRWWDNNEKIDLIILGDRIAELIDCRWTDQPLGTNILGDLERKAELVRPDLPGHQFRFGLCSRSGFTRQLVDIAARRDDVDLFPLPKILAI